MLQVLWCLFGKHFRDRRRARVHEDGTVTSVCRGCGRPMIKEYFGSRAVWRIQSESSDTYFTENGSDV